MEIKFFLRMHTISCMHDASDSSVGMLFIEALRFFIRKLGAWQNQDYKRASPTHTTQQDPRVPALFF